MNSTDVRPPGKTKNPATLGKSKGKAARGGTDSKTNLPASAEPAQPLNVSPATEIRHESYAHNSMQEITFRLDAPSAREVLLAGQFTEWEKSAVKLTKGGGGVWHVKLPLPAGRHAYRFLVDGQWQDDQNRPEREPNPFGTQNSVVIVN